MRIVGIRHHRSSKWRSFGRFQKGPSHIQYTIASCSFPKKGSEENGWESW